MGLIARGVPYCSSQWAGGGGWHASLFVSMDWMRGYNFNGLDESHIFCLNGLGGAVPIWLSGSVALWLLWLCGSVALWVCGSVAQWFCGSVALLFLGDVERSQNVTLNSRIFAF